MKIARCMSSPVSTGTVAGRGRGSGSGSGCGSASGSGWAADGARTSEDDRLPRPDAEEAEEVRLPNP